MMSIVYSKKMIMVPSSALLKWRRLSGAQSSCPTHRHPAIRFLVIIIIIIMDHKTCQHNPQLIIKFFPDSSTPSYVSRSPWPQEHQSSNPGREAGLPSSIAQGSLTMVQRRRYGTSSSSPSPSPWSSSISTQSTLSSSPDRKPCDSTNTETSSADSRDWRSSSKACSRWWWLH